MFLTAWQLGNVLIGSGLGLIGAGIALICLAEKGW